MGKRSLIAQLRRMARAAKAQGDKAIAADLARVAKWARTFGGWQSRPSYGPGAPFIAGEWARVTGAALQSAMDRSAADHSAMLVAWRGN